MDTGDIFRDFRTRHALTQSELGRLSGVPQPVLSASEHGPRTPMLDTLERRAAGGRTVTKSLDESGTAPICVPARRARTRIDRELHFSVQNHPPGRCERASPLSVSGKSRLQRKRHLHQEPGRGTSWHRTGPNPSAHAGERVVNARRQVCPDTPPTRTAIVTRGRRRVDERRVSRRTPRVGGCAGCR